MARSSGTVGKGTFRERFDQAAFRHPGTGSEFQVKIGENGYQMEFARGEVAERRELRWFIGSGSVGRSYLFSMDNFLFQAPVSYYSAAGKWDTSPGYQGMRSVDLTRMVETACLQCHATGVQTVSGSQNRFAAEPFREGGVGCERCHGDGAKHVARMTGRKTGALEIVNPAKLPGERRDSVCAQCHLTGAARVARAGAAAFQPGGRMADSIAVFVWEEAAGSSLGATSHFEKLAASKCRKESGGKLWCGTCHNVHGRPVSYRQRCENCHREHGCSEKAEVRAHAGNDCVACHMPKRGAASSEHLAFTDHAIPRRPGGGEVIKGLRPFWESSDRDLALAYAVVAPGEPTVRQEAFDRLRAAAAGYPDDVPVLSQLAQFYDRMGREDEAAALCERILNLDPLHGPAAVNLGSYRAKGGRLEEAITLWRGALTRNPALTGARMNLAVGLHQAGHREEAREALREALRWDPDAPAPRRLLREMQ